MARIHSSGRSLGEGEGAPQPASNPLDVFNHLGSRQPVKIHQHQQHGGSMDERARQPAQARTPNGTAHRGHSKLAKSPLVGDGWTGRPQLEISHPARRSQ
eukprot:11750095-Alexandrium_andersonii.AAC.1